MNDDNNIVTVNSTIRDTSRLLTRNLWETIHHQRVPEAETSCPLLLSPLLSLTKTRLSNVKDIWAHAIEVCLSYTLRLIIVPTIGI